MREPGANDELLSLIIVSKFTFKHGNSENYLHENKAILDWFYNLGIAKTKELQQDPSDSVTL